MLNNLRNLFLKALRCEDENIAKELIEEWNKEISYIQKIFDKYS